VAPALYGLFLGILFFGVDKFAPQPGGAIVLWTVFGAQLAWGARICWRRTGLPFATAAMLTGATISASLVLLAAMGHPFPNLEPSSWVFYGAGAALGVVFLFIESRVNRAKWQAWARHIRTTSARDVFTARHIPRLRDS
jgi:hypothetical protein